MKRPSFLAPFLLALCLACTPFVSDAAPKDPSLTPAEFQSLGAPPFGGDLWTTREYSKAVFAVQKLGAAEDGLGKLPKIGSAKSGDFFRRLSAVYPATLPDRDVERWISDHLAQNERLTSLAMLYELAALRSGLGSDRTPSSPELAALRAANAKISAHAAAALKQAIPGIAQGDNTLKAKVEKAFKTFADAETVRVLMRSLADAGIAPEERATYLAALADYGVPLSRLLPASAREAVRDEAADLAKTVSDDAKKILAEVGQDE